ncbi:TlpA family protein disulfide reductase [Thermosulfuriphilus sp.]
MKSFAKLVFGVTLALLLSYSLVQGSVGCRKAYDFRLQAIDGNQVSLSQFKGKVILVNFFATYCPPCRMEIPGFVDVYEKYKEQGFIVIGVSVDTRPYRILPDFVRFAGITYPVVIADEKTIAEYDNVYQLPTSFLIDGQGCIVKKYLGFIPESQLERDIKPLLPSESP